MVFKFLSKHKKSLTILFLVFVVTSFSFAAGNDSTGAEKQIGEVVGNIVNFFSSGWVKGIACIALIAECIGLLFAGGQNPQLFKKFLPLIAGTVIFMCAGKIVTMIFGSSDLDFKSDMNLSYIEKTIENPYSEIKETLV